MRGNVTVGAFALQVILKPIVPKTQSELLKHSLAAERRRVRMLHDDIIKDLLSHRSFQQGRLPAAHSYARHLYQKVAVCLFNAAFWLFFLIQSDSIVGSHC